MTDKPTRRALMRPLQLLTIAFVLAAFALFVTAAAMGAFTDLTAEEIGHIWTVAAIVAGVAFIAVLLVVAMLLLVVDPAEVQKPVDRAVLLPPETGAVEGEPAGSGAADDGTGPVDDGSDGAASA